MPAPSLLIVCLPSQTKVAPRPAPLSGVPGRAPGPAGTGTKSSSLSPIQTGLNTSIQPCCPSCSWLLSPLLLPLPQPLGWLWEETGAVLIMQKGEG